MKYTLYGRKRTFYLHIGEWIHPDGYIVFEHGNLTAMEVPVFMFAQHAKVYEDVPHHWFGIHSYSRYDGISQAHVCSWMKRTGEFDFMGVYEG